MLVWGRSAGPRPSVTLAWDRSLDPSVSGYIVYWGTNSRSYSSCLTVQPADNTTARVTNLLWGVRYYFAATCFNYSGLESDFSQEISYTTWFRPVETTKTKTGKASTVQQ